MKRCRYCGGKILDDASQCEHCGKMLGESKSGSAETPGLTNLDSWENKSVPAWVMYLVVAFFSICLIFVMIKGCEKPATKPSKNENAGLLQDLHVGLPFDVKTKL